MSDGIGVCIGAVCRGAVGYMMLRVWVVEGWHWVGWGGPLQVVFVLMYCSRWAVCIWLGWWWGLGDVVGSRQDDCAVGDAVCLVGVDI